MTGVIQTNPKVQFLAADGSPLVGGKLYTYLAGTSTLTPTWQDLNQSTANTNPIILDARGEAVIWLDPALAYKFVLQTSANVAIWTVDNITGSTPATFMSILEGSGGSALVGFIQAGSGAVARTAQSKMRETVSVLDFGAVGDGTTDDRAAVQSALNTGKAVYFPTPATSYYLSDSVAPVANQLIYGDGAASHIQVKDGSVNGFYVNGVSGVIIRDLKISTKSQTNPTGYIAGIAFVNECRNGLVENVSMFNLAFWGVSITNSSGCIVRGCRFATWFGSLQDSAAVAIYKTSNNNLIEGNYCTAASYHGIFMQDPYTNDTPTGNSIINNYVSNALADGITAYVTTAYDTQTVISGNRIFDIIGSALSGNSGHGIYIQSAGGTIVSNNTISNCCQQTTTFETQVVAAIGVSTGDTTIYPTGTINEVIVSNNHITAQRGPAISVQTCSAPVLVEGNVILSTGTTAVRGEAIYSISADGLQIKNNSIKHANTNYFSIQVSAIGRAVYGVSITGNNIRTAYSGPFIQSALGGSLTGTVVSGNTIWGGVSGAGVYLSALTGATVSNNTITATGQSYYQNACTKVQLLGNSLISTSGAASIVFSGGANSNAGTFAHESNTMVGLVENNAGTGAIISQYASSAPPLSGLWAIGDRVIQSVPVVGNPTGWRCTVAGNPGTWTSEGNL